MPSAHPPISRGRSAAYMALTSLGSLVLALGLGEALLQVRWVPPSALTTPAFGPHPLYASAPLPGASGAQVCEEYYTHFEHNLLGFRGPLPDLTPADSPAAERPRLLVVGDSQTYGLGCPEGQTFCAELRTRLHGVELLNTGCNGYGTRDELAVVHHLGEAWRPDVVLLVFFWNDLGDNVKRSVPRFGLDEQGKLERLDPYDAKFDPLALRRAVHTKPRGAAGLRLPRFFKEGLRGLRYRLFGIHRRTILNEGDLREAWKVTRALLELLTRRCAELDSQLVIAWLPNHTQVDPKAVIRNIDPINYEVQDELFAACDELGIRTIDLLPALRARFEQTGRSLYYYADRHLKPEGHAVVGEALAEGLGALGSLGGDHD